jgi:ferritin-like metal-binding protein YciE
MSRTTNDELVHFLSDMYSVELQALVQMASAPAIAGFPKLAEDFAVHYTETQQQAEMVRERLEAHGGKPSLIKDAIMKLGGKGFLLFARVMPETPGRLIDHAYSYEAMEWAGYEMLARFAERAVDVETMQVAKTVGDQERTMMERLERNFDAAEEVTHKELSPEKLRDHIEKHLAEVHAFETQNIQLLSKSEEIGGNVLLDAIYSEHRDKLERHAELVESRLDALGSDTSKLKDSALTLGAFNWGYFFQAQSDTPAKLAAFVYAVLHLEIGGYELLKRTARRAGDSQTQRLCERVIGEKQNMAQRLHAAFDSAILATLEAVA